MIARKGGGRGTERDKNRDLKSDRESDRCNGDKIQKGDRER